MTHGAMETGTYFRDSLIASLDGLAKEIMAFDNEEDLWTTPSQISNSAGTLAMHLTGNMNHFIGSVLGNTGYVRDRESEFRLRNVPRHELVARISDTREQVYNSFNLVTPERLSDIYPLTTFGENKSTMYVLLVLCTHASYHLGQVNYIRRMLNGVNNG